MVGQEELYKRIEDAPWAVYKTHMTIGGAGGLGSWLAFFLSRIGHSMSVYDFDVVGDENVGGGQLYGLEHIGREKTSALKEVVNRFSGQTPFIGMGRFEKGSAVNPLTFATFDNMESRKIMFKQWCELIRNRTPEQAKAHVWGFMNVSMLPEGGFIELIDRPSRIKRWNDDWVPSDQIPDLVCTFKSTTHNAASVAAKVVSVLNNMVCNKMSNMPDNPLAYRFIIDNKMLTVVFEF